LELYEKYGKYGLAVLGFPCDQFGGQAPGSDKCEREYAWRKFGFDFPVFDKVHIEGEETHEAYRVLKDPKFESAVGRYNASMPFKHVLWNYEKFLVNADGVPVNHYLSGFDPRDMEADVRKVLGL